MEITVLDFILFNSLSFFLGIAGGLGICCKHKDKFMSRSRSLENITNSSFNHQQTLTAPSENSNNIVMATAPMAPVSSPQQKTLRLTVE